MSAFVAVYESLSKSSGAQYDVVPTEFLLESKSLRDDKLLA